jgi:hypothetical protein
MRLAEVSGRPTFGEVVGQVGRICRAQWRTLLVAGLIVFVPLGLVDVAGADLFDLDDPDPGLLAAGLVAVAASVIAALAGEAIYAGIVAAAVVAEREGVDRPVSEVVRHLALGRLLAVDLLAALVIAAGFVALIIPGFLFVAWFALVAPALEIEGLRVLACFRRSRELVRGHVWFVLGLVLPTLIVEDVLADALQSASLWGIGEGFVGDWVGSVLANLVTSPFYAVAVTVLFFELRERRGAT